MSTKQLLKKVYFISGLGADKRVFGFLDLSFCDPVFIDWIEPHKKESLESYAIRLRSLIPEVNAIIVGISFGGMLVTEMAKADKNIKGIIISSNKTRNEFPKYFRIAKFLPVYNWFNSGASKKMLSTLRWILGAKGEKQRKALRQIIIDSDMNFIKWALGAIFNWKNKEIPANIIHIHGTADKLLPYRLVKADYTIERGTHVMVMNNPEEIATLLRKLLN
ncbi:MAG: alpha/beta hydrolase [Chitinophagaceae bacterium]|jgi:pimeloyl-ACP methyl ester carboxylesterase|nr:alpha/beta hydrolase [Chitinophagaceae bacterium]OQY94608.1 MAG: hypothetical protein B6D37_08010 [Sphingobacteriales bacterium UTBCD1]